MKSLSNFASNDRKMETLIVDTNYHHPLIKCRMILCDARLTKLMIKIEALLDYLPNFWITKDKEAIILDENGSLLCH